MEGVAHTILVVRAGAASHLAVPPEVVRTLDRWVRSVHAAARWMARPDVWHAGLASDSPYTHRRFLVAAALGLTAKLTGDGSLARDAHAALLSGLGRQRRDGVFPELGGHDSSYQARGIAYAEQYLAWVPDRSHAGLAGAIDRGIAWEQGRVRPSGQVLTVGNTRANGVMRDHNGVKRVVYPMVARALAWWGLIAARPRLVRLGRAVTAWAIGHPAQVGR